MSIVDRVYDIPLHRLFIVALGIGVAAAAISFSFFYVLPAIGLVIVFAIPFTAVWIVLLVLSLAAHGRPALWLALTAPLVLLGPALIGLFVYGCVAQDVCV